MLGLKLSLVLIGGVSYSEEIEGCGMYQCPKETESPRFSICRMSLDTGNYFFLQVEMMCWESWYLTDKSNTLFSSLTGGLEMNHCYGGNMTTIPQTHKTTSSIHSLTNLKSSGEQKWGCGVHRTVFGRETLISSTGSWWSKLTWHCSGDQEGLDPFSPILTCNFWGPPFLGHPPSSNSLGIIFNYS